jgi:uncharacterized protein (DUF427 family)
MGRRRIEPGQGQESVWDYPPPPRLEDVDRKVKVVFGGVTLAYTTRAKRILETSHPPVYYIPPEDPTPRFAGLEDYVAFYPSRMDGCWVGGEKVEAQEGDFYGGWITSDIIGPFKGAPGTSWGW